MNFIMSTTRFNPHHRWQGYRTSWPLKDVTGNSFHHMDSLRRIMGSSSKVHEVPSAKNIGFSCCHLRGTVHINCWNRGLSKFRHLFALSDDPFKPTYLTAGHFLIGEGLIQLSAADYTDVKCNRLYRWQTYQQKLQQLWQRWSTDYVQGLQQCQRWHRTFPNLQPGEFVLLRKDNTTPLYWPTAVIKETHLRKDGIIRVVTIRTQGRFQTSHKKIRPLPRENSEL